VLHRWVEMGKLYPFKQVLKSDFILPDLRKEFIDQLCTHNDHGKNPLHIVAESKYDEGRRVEVARFLVESYKRERPARSTVNAAKSKVAVVQEGTLFAIGLGHSE